MSLVNIRLVEDSDDGGIRQSERQYIPELRNLGIEVIGVVIGDDFGNYSDQKDDFAFVHKLERVDFIGGLPTKLKKLIKSVETARPQSIRLSNQLNELIHKSEPQQIVINIRRISLLPLAYFLALKLKAKVVYHSGGSFLGSKISPHYLFYRLLQKLPRFTMLANSQFSAQSYGLAHESYVYPGFSLARLEMLESSCRSELRKKLGIPIDSPVFLFLARLNFDKAPDLLVEGFINSKSAKESQAYLILAGPVQSADLFAQIEAKIKNSDLKNRVLIVGPQSNVGDWFYIADIFVNSRRGVEPFGISIVEAMASGLPVITSAYGGPRETVLEKENGWLVKDLSEEGYRQAIELALLERDKWKEFGNKSLELSERFASENQVKRYIKKVFGTD